MKNKITLSFRTELPTYNDITHWSYSRANNGYMKAKKFSHVLLQNELDTVPGNIEALANADTLKDAPGIKTTYIWHTTHGYDLSNLSFGTKFIEDALNLAGTWKDDSLIIDLRHVLITDTEDYCELIIEW